MIFANTCATSPATHRAKSKSWIIWSITGPPDSSGSANHDAVGMAVTRLSRITAT